MMMEEETDSEYEVDISRDSDGDDDDDSAVSWDRVDEDEDAEMESEDEERRIRILREYNDEASVSEDDASFMSAESLERTDRKGKTKLHHLIDMEMYEAAIQQLKLDPSDASVQDSEGWTPLHILVQQDFPDGDLDDLKNSPFVSLFHELLRAFPDAAVTRDALRNTPLHQLVGSDTSNLLIWVSLELLRALVQCNPKALSMASLDNMLPLHVAMYSSGQGDEDDPSTPPIQQMVIETLLDAHEPAASSPDSSGMYPLHHLCRHCSMRMNVAVFERLMEAFPDAVRLKDECGRSPLHHYMRNLADSEIVVSSCLRTFEILLKANPAALCAPNAYGDRPLDDFFHACFPYMIYSRVPPIEDSPDFEQYSLQHEEDEAFWSLVHMVLETAHYNLKDAKSELSFSNREDWLVIHCATAVGCPTRWIERFIEMHPHQLMEKDRDGNLPLMIAASTSDCAGSTDEDGENHTWANGRVVLHTLLEANPEAARVPNRQGRLPLHVALENARVDDRGIVSLIQAAPQALSTRDVKTRMYPALLAATCRKNPGGESVEPAHEAASKLGVCFELLREYPAIISLAS